MFSNNRSTVVRDYNDGPADKSTRARDARVKGVGAYEDTAASPFQRRPQVASLICDAVGLGGVSQTWRLLLCLVARLVSRLSWRRFGTRYASGGTDGAQELHLLQMQRYSARHS
jgi:hypothetical protein